MGTLGEGQVLAHPWSSREGEVNAGVYTAHVPLLAQHRATMQAKAAALVVYQGTEWACLLGEGHLGLRGIPATITLSHGLCPF